MMVDRHDLGAIAGAVVYAAAITGLAVGLVVACAMFYEARADTGDQWDTLVKSQNEVWVKTSRGRRVHSTSLSGVVAPLAAKAREIIAGCPGSKVISAVRHTRIAGTRTMSLHASGRAVDMQGNPRCIYRHLAHWPGGVSTDYHRVLHVHFSYGGREDGLRFAHSGGRKQRHARRYAKAGL